MNRVIQNVEIALIFVPALALVCFGAFLVPIQVWYLYSEGFNSKGSWPALMLVFSFIGGVAGLVALINLALSINGSKIKKFSQRTWCILIGFAYGGALLGFSLAPATEIKLLLIVIMTIGIHLQLIGRRYRVSSS